MSISASDILERAVLTGAQFGEPMRVIGNPTAGDGFVLVNLVGTGTSIFRGGVTLTFSLKVLTRPAEAENVEIKVKAQATLTEGQTAEPLNRALKELGISETFKKPNS